MYECLILGDEAAKPAKDSKGQKHSDEKPVVHIKAKMVKASKLNKDINQLNENSSASVFYLELLQFDILFRNSFFGSITD